VSIKILMLLMTQTQRCFEHKVGVGWVDDYADNILKAWKCFIAWSLSVSSNLACSYIRSLDKNYVRICNKALISTVPLRQIWFFRIGSWVGPEPVWIQCPCRESNPSSSNLNPLALSLSRLSYLDIYIRKSPAPADYGGSAV
jgi:hypothetical protein